MLPAFWRPTRQAVRSFCTPQAEGREAARTCCSAASILCPEPCCPDRTLAAAPAAAAAPSASAPVPPCFGCCAPAAAPGPGGCGPVSGRAPATGASLLTPAPDPWPGRCCRGGTADPPLLALPLLLMLLRASSRGNSGPSLPLTLTAAALRPGVGGGSLDVGGCGAAAAAGESCTWWGWDGAGGGKTCKGPGIGQPRVYVVCAYMHARS